LKHPVFGFHLIHSAIAIRHSQIYLSPPRFRRTLSATMTSQERGLQEFAGFASKLKGDEKSEAQP
jgi:hypothetical protein